MAQSYTEFLSLLEHSVELRAITPCDSMVNYHKVIEK